MAEAKRLYAIPYDVKYVELGHHGKESSFEAILQKYKLTGDPALVLTEAALARLPRPLSPADQRIVVEATRTPHKVRWPEWRSEHP
jgi:hypothetical protein